MLLGDFYNFSIEEYNEGNISAIIEINKEHDILKGHFPEQPIVPGVAQILMIKEIICNCFERDLQLISSKSIKFLAMLNPNQISTINAEITYIKEGNTYKVNAKLHNKEHNFLKLKGIYSVKK